MTATATASRARLDRRRVLEAALALVDREGLEALTMRRLGAELRVDPMTVHHHAESKDRLLDGIAELLWEEVALPEDSGDPAKALRGPARSEREVLLYLGQALPPGTPPDLASAAAAMIAECDSDRCFEEGLDLMLAGLPVRGLRGRQSTSQPQGARRPWLA